MSLRMSKYERSRTGSISSPENPFTTVRRRNYFRLSYLILQSSKRSTYKERPPSGAAPFSSIFSLFLHFFSVNHQLALNPVQLNPLLRAGRIKGLCCPLRFCLPRESFVYGDRKQGCDCHALRHTGNTSLTPFNTAQSSRCIKLVLAPLSVSGYGMPCSFARAKLRIIQTIFRARFRMVCMPSRSLAASSAVSPWEMFQ